MNNSTYDIAVIGAGAVGSAIARELSRHKLDIVLLEASLIPINRGCPLIAEVIEFMAHHGYRMLDFGSQVRRTDFALWQIDLFFVKHNSTSCPRVTSLTGDQ